MLIVLGLAVTVLSGLVFLVLLLRRRRSAAAAPADTADLTSRGPELPDQEPELDLPVHGDADLRDSMAVRVLRAQVRTLEQALERADEATGRPEPREAMRAHAEAAPTVARAIQTQLEVPQVPQAPQVPPAAGHDLLAAAPDVVLPVPPLALPEARRSHRWFRRSAA